MGWRGFALLGVMAVMVLGGCGQERPGDEGVVERFAGAKARRDLQLLEGPVVALGGDGDVLTAAGSSQAVVESGSDRNYAVDTAVWVDLGSGEITRQPLGPGKVAGVWEDRVVMLNGGTVRRIAQDGKRDVWQTGLARVDSVTMVSDDVAVVREKNGLYRYDAGSGKLALLYEGPDSAQVRSVVRDPESSSTVWFIDSSSHATAEESGHTTICKMDVNRADGLTTHVVESAGMVESLYVRGEVVLVKCSAVVYRYDRETLELVNVVGTEGRGWLAVDDSGLLAAENQGVTEFMTGHQMIRTSRMGTRGMLRWESAKFVGERRVAIGWEDGVVSLAEF